MTALITPGQKYEHLDATRAKEVLLMFIQLEPHSFTIAMNDDNAVKNANAHIFYRDFFIRHGLLYRDKENVLQLTTQGIALATGDIREPISREAAVVAIEGLRKRAAWILDDPDQIYYIRGIFIFGSYVDSDKAMLGDIDVGLAYGIKPEYHRMADQQLMLITRSIQKRACVADEVKPVDDAKIWATDRMLEFLHGGHQYISLHASTELPTLRIENVLWVYDSKGEVSEPFVMSKNELVIINSFLKKSI